MHETSHEPSSPSPTLRTLIFRGGAYLAIRQALGVLIGVAGPIFLLREIGPNNYGLYAAALSILTYIQLLSQWGVEVYLMRHPESEDCPEVYHSAFTLLIGLSILGTLAGLCSLPYLNHWMRLRGFVSPAWVMLLTLPFLTLRQVPLAMLERKLDYKHIAIVELCGQICFYLFALPLAFRDRSVWAPVAGWYAQQFLLMALFFVLARYRPALHFDLQMARRILSYGLGYSSAVWVWQIRTLINPLVVGRYVGSDAVGFVALAIRVVETLSFARSAAWRISIAALARLQEDTQRLLRAIGEGMRLQTLAIGPPLVLFAVAGPTILAHLFGRRWAPAMVVYPFIALSSLSNAAFTLQASTLYVIRKNWAVAAFGLVHLGLFGGSALLLVPHLGMIGYGWAEVVALPSYFLLHRAVAKRIGKPDYLIVAVWWLAFGIAMFEPFAGWPLLTGLLLILVWPRSIRQIWGYARDIRTSTFR